jgi:hypothetical protein
VVTPAELDALADRVAGRLREPMISAALPEEVGQLFREAAKYGPWKAMFVMPLHGEWGIRSDWTVNVDGSLILRLEYLSGELFWHGTFRPDNGA